MSDVMTTMVAVENSILTMDTIRYDGKLWLVPEWYEQLESRLQRPVRIVRIDHLPHSVSTNAAWDFVLNEPMPKDVLEGRVPSGQEQRYEVVELPPVILPIVEAKGLS